MTGSSRPISSPRPSIDEGPYHVVDGGDEFWTVQGPGYTWGPFNDEWQAAYHCNAVNAAFKVGKLPDRHTGESSFTGWGWWRS